MTLVSIMRDAWDLLGLHWNQKYQKLGKKRLSYGQFTNGRLRDLSEYHAGCMGSIKASFEPKYLKSGKKWLSYGQFIKRRLRDSSEYHGRCKGSIRASLQSKISKIGPEMTKLRPIYQREVA